MKSISDALSATDYPGRGIVVGRSEDGGSAVCAYFIMGRSENSKNRVFEIEGEGIRTQAYDAAKLSDPSLVIYAPVRVLENRTILSNGDQTDTIFDFLRQGKTFEQALRTRNFEPDEPNRTPRISAMITAQQGSFSYTMSILKSDRTLPDCCLRYFYEFEQSAAGTGRFIHTYEGNGSPLPSFVGEPEAVELRGDIDEVARVMWDSLDFENKVALFVRFIKLYGEGNETRLINKLSQ